MRISDVSGLIPRCVVAHLGRFLPRLGPFVRAAPSLCARRLCRCLGRLALAEPCHRCASAMQYDSPCILCAAHLHRMREASDHVVGFVALLGRFLPRLGPHGPPRGPFYFPKAGVGRPSRKADGRSKVGERGMAQARLRIATQHNRAASRSSLRCRPPLQQQRQRGEHLGGHVSERTRQLLEILAL